MTTIRPTGATLPLAAPLDVAPSPSVRAPAPTGLGPAQSVLADLQAARISPDEAVQRLTALAVASSGCPEAMRPAVERRMRGVITSDPLVASLLQRMGASAPADE
jgi:hypothetical protein